MSQVAPLLLLMLISVSGLAAWLILKLRQLMRWWYRRHPRPPTDAEIRQFLDQHAR